MRIPTLRITGPVGCTLLAVVGCVTVGARAEAPIFRATAVLDADRTVVQVNRDLLRSVVQSRSAGRMRAQLPVEGGIELGLAPFRVTRSDTRYVVGRLGGPNEPLASFDPSQVTLLRGSARGDDGSVGHAYFAVSDRFLVGHVAVGGQRWDLTGQAPSLQRGEALIARAHSGGDPLPPGVPFCATDTAQAGPLPFARDAVPPTRGLQRLELAVETDYEFYQRFNDLDAAAFYVTALYGAVSDIYVRDMNTRVELTFVRLWDTPADMFNDADPLVPFRDWWNANMGAVPRDAAQFLTGRRNLPYGGVAWLTGLCGSFGYSVAGLINGSFDPTLSGGSGQWDVIVAAHELGHNCGTAHTHDYGLDDCYPHPGTEQRSTIMGYCHTQNGGTANTDVRFHRDIRDLVTAFVAASFCIDDDCNANSVPDAQDISAGTSADTNANNIPDECEDCDGDATLDDAEITGGAPDLDANSVPDACQSDCNSNGFPDRLDIDAGTSVDTDANSLPDECDADCDGNGVPDHDQIFADMHLDVNRNELLDACEDCDGDGTPDIVELAGAHDLWVVGSTATAYSYQVDTGARRVSSSGGIIDEAQDVIVGPNGNMLVASGDNWRVIEFNRNTGAFVRNFVSTGSGGLRYPAGLAVGPNSDLFVSSRDTDAIFKYDGSTGAFITQFVLPNVGGLNDPYGLTFGPDKNLYVCSGATNQVLKYDGVSGAFLGVFVSAGSGSLSAPRGLTFKHDGNLLVASSGNGRVLEYARGTGAFVRIFNRAFSNVGTDLDAWDVAIGPNGNVFVARHAAEYRIFELEAETGIYLQSFVRGPYSGLSAPTGVAFADGFLQDCNVNQVPDNCEIASGALADADSNSIPDVCEADCNGNGLPDWLEIVPRGTRLDCNFNGVLDDCELASGAAPAGVCIACDAPGDFDSDGDFDLLDVYRFTQCSGADVAVRPECLCANVDDSNQVVDQADWSALEAVLTGPQ